MALRAKQQLQLQETNSALVDIRALELNYYDNYFQNFGGMGAMIAGFLFGR